MSAYDPKRTSIACRRVVAITANSVAIQNSSTGNVLTYCKHRKPAFGPLGDSLNDFVA
jgi:hypothetical protein